MKKVLLTLCIWLYAMLCIGQGVSHLEFKGIPIDGNLQEFVSKMKLEGFYSKMYNNEGVIMQGDFVGENSHVFIYSTTEEKVVWKVSVYFDSWDNWLSLENQYYKIKDMYTKKYGKPKKHYESFSNERVPIDKMRAVNSDICDYASYYFFQNGVIVVSISPFGCVKVSYEDEYNSLLGKQEEEKYRDNDI